MKNWKKLALCAMIGTILLLPNEVNAASLSFSDMTVKGAFLVIALIVILLLLYLGYRMDSNEGVPKPKKSKKKEFVESKDKYVKKQQPVETYVSNDNVYEEDSREYEVDNVNPEDISESMEYEEDNIAYQPEEDFNTISSNTEPEKSLFEASNNDFGSTISFDSSLLNKELNSVSDVEDIVEEDDFEDVDTEEDDFEDIDTAEDDFEDVSDNVVEDDDFEDVDAEDDEEFGEEFDTSIIDNIDNDFEDEVFSTAVPKTTTVVEEEFVEEIIKDDDFQEDEEFGEEFDTSIIDSIDDDFEDVKTSESFTTKTVVEEETDFPGFSVGTSSSKSVEEELEDLVDDLEDVPVIEENPVVEKPRKRYTKVSTKKVETTVSTGLDEDFMRQMEANLGDGATKEAKPAKKTSTRKKKTE